jgi:hypothetical protein
MLPVGFEPIVSAGERPQTYALDRAASGISILMMWRHINTRINNCYKTERPGDLIPTAGRMDEVPAILTTIFIVMSAVGLSIGVVMTMITMVWMIMSVIERGSLRML